MYTLSTNLLAVLLACLPLLRPGGAMCPYNGQSLLSAPHAGVGDKGRSLSTSTPLEGAIPSASDTSDPLVQVNQYFHSMYDIARESLVPSVNMMHEGDYLVLHLANGSRIVEPVVHPVFHDLKMMCHLPLGAYSILLANTSDSVQLDSQTLGNLQGYQQLLENVSLTEERFTSPQQLDRQRYIYNLTVDFVSGVLQSGTCSLEEMAAFAWSTALSISVNLDEAAEDTINATHAVVMHWKNKFLSENDWNSLYTATSTGHMASQDFSIHQYFVRLFGGSVSKGCGENQGWELFDEKAFGFAGHYTTEEIVAKDVSVHYTDYPIGRDFFHDLYRMHSDALADGAKKALDKIFGPEKLPDDEGTSDGDNGENDAYVTKFSIILLSLLGLAFLCVVGVVAWCFKTFLCSPVRSRKDSNIEVSTRNILQ